MRISRRIDKRRKHTCVPDLDADFQPCLALYAVDDPARLVDDVTRLDFLLVCVIVLLGASVELIDVGATT